VGYNAVGDDTVLSSFVWLLLRTKSAKSREILWKFELIQLKVIKGHRLGVNRKRVCNFL